MKVIKGAAKSKTIYLALAVGVLGYLEMNKAAVEPFIPEKWRGIAGIVLGAAILVCRFFTSESLQEKGTPANENAQ